MNAANQIAIRHFGRKIVRDLSKKGIRIVGTQAYRVEYPNGSWGYETAYKLDDNGTGKVRNYFEVLEINK
jgi:hypothetical protein